MSRRKRFLFVLLFPIIALAAARGGNLQNRESLPCEDRALPASAAAARSPQSTLEFGARTGFRPRFRSNGAGGQLRPASLLPAQFSIPTPIQFQDPRTLGVGRLLVAARGLGDPNFAERVVLIVHYDETSVVGLVLNLHTDLPLSRVFDLKAAKDRTDTVYLGGPVEPSSVLALLQSPARIGKAENVFGGVYLISDKSVFERTISSRPDPHAFHVFLGYSGWTRDQLRSEVELGAWYIFPADAATVFNSDPDALWLQMIHRTEFESAAIDIR